MHYKTNDILINPFDSPDIGLTLLVVRSTFSRHQLLTFLGVNTGGGVRNLGGQPSFCNFYYLNTLLQRFTTALLDTSK